MPGGLPLALTSDVPGRDPAGNARRLFANLHQRGHRPGSLAGDILYTNQDEAQFQTPAREAGYDLVLGYGKDQEGVQGAHSSGALMVEGTYMAPCIPDDLRTATTRLRNGDLYVDRLLFADLTAARDPGGTTGSPPGATPPGVIETDDGEAA